ncbi:MAG TPA: hypothetical protein VE129_07420 [Thermoanaerobaculia bacterium]|nr:hypothetical protein [Thermoanaerobaculia bacterium]
MRIALGAVGLLALGWGGVSRLRRTADGVAVRASDPSLTEHFAARVAAAEHAAVSSEPPAASQDSRPDSGQLQNHATDDAPGRTRSPLELQRFRKSTSMTIRGPGGREGTAVLTDLNPRINDGYVLELSWHDGEETWLHLENAHPDLNRIVLDPEFPSGLVVEGSGESRLCDLWSDKVPNRMEELSKRQRPYTELCDGDVLVRHRTQGSRTSREWAADFLRSNVPGGEGLTSLVKNTVYPDAFLEKAEVVAGASAAPAPPDGPGFPRPALVSPDHRADRLVSRELGIPIAEGGSLVVGRWYPAVGSPGVFVSLMTPGRVAREVLEKSPVRDLDATEEEALVYLIAFDLERFDLGYGLGTDHPGVGWSERAEASSRKSTLPGPDGFADAAPLEPTGFVPPQVADRVVATFAGGFKRAHGAFRSGAFARVNSGSHYGFVEGGTVLSTLQPGLSTLFALDDGSVEMKTWSRPDDALLERVRSARQNGVPLLERDSRTGVVGPGALVGRWGDGNWGGSQDSRLRSVRAGAGVQEWSGRRFLVFGYFSSATPSAMAVVLASFGCQYAMHLDMNAPEHTYLAIYREKDGKLDIDHLVRAMSVLDKTSGGTTVPRFLAVADNRDFFYLMKKRGERPQLPAHPGAAGPSASMASPASHSSP